MNLNDAKNVVLINNQYYLLKNANNIEIYNHYQTLIDNLKTNLNYNSLTFNDINKKFYLSIDGENNFIHETQDFEIFNKIELDCNLNNEKIKYLFYCKCFDGILITTPKRIYLYNLKNKHCKLLFEVKEKCIKINDCMEPLGQNINQSINLVATICCNHQILVIYQQASKSYIALLKNKELDEIIYQIEAKIISVCILHDEIWVLIERDCHHKWINTEIECGCSNQKCECQIIESIAMIEKSIAKILESESKKIKAAIDITEDVNDLICINSSVKDVIYYITVLEFILAEKLKTVKKKDDCDC